MTMSGFPFGWIGFLIVMMCVSSVLRSMFGGWRRWEGRDFDRLRPRDRASREDVERLDAEIANRDAVIDDFQRRLSEVEARLDFSERLLAERANVARLDPVAGASAQ